MNLVSKTRAALALVGYSADSQLAAQIALLLSTAERVRCMLLDGPPGAGKTSLAKAVAKMLKVNVVYTAITAGTSDEDILTRPNMVRILRGVAGDASAVNSAEDVISLGFLPRVFEMSQQGLTVAFVDELDKGQEDVDNCFLTALEEGEVVVEGRGVVKAKLENLILFFTKNNKSEVSEPLMRRCRRAYLGFPSESLEMQILTGAVKVEEPKEAIRVPFHRLEAVPAPIAQVLIKLANQLRSKEQDLIKPPATQEVLQAGLDVVRLAQWGSLPLAGEVVFGWLAGYQEDRQILKSITSVDQLNAALQAAVKSSGTEVHAKRDLEKPDDEFVDLV